MVTLYLRDGELLIPELALFISGCFGLYKALLHVESIHSFSQHPLNPYCVLGVMLGSGHTEENKTDKVPALRSS